jgi:hypothetical protein
MQNEWQRAKWLQEFSFPAELGKSSLLLCNLILIKSGGRADWITPATRNIGRKGKEKLYHLFLGANCVSLKNICF